MKLLLLKTYPHGFTSQYKEGLGALSQESRKFVNQDILDLVRLLDANADAHTVHAGLNENPLILIASHCQWVQKHFGGTGSFNFRHVMSLGSLGCEIGYGQSGCQGRANTLEVRPKRLRLDQTVSFCRIQLFALRFRSYHDGCVNSETPRDMLV